jgi:hypothetical protein
LKLAVVVAHPLVDSEAFKQQGRNHPIFGKPVTGFDLFHGTDKIDLLSIMQNGFDDLFFNPEWLYWSGRILGR